MVRKIWALAWFTLLLVLPAALAKHDNQNLRIQRLSQSQNSIRQPRKSCYDTARSTPICQNSTSYITRLIQSPESKTTLETLLDAKSDPKVKFICIDNFLSCTGKIAIPYNNQKQVLADYKYIKNDLALSGLLHELNPDFDGFVNATINYFSKYNGDRLIHLLHNMINVQGNYLRTQKVWIEFSNALNFVIKDKFKGSIPPVTLNLALTLDLSNIKSIPMFGSQFRKAFFNNDVKAIVSELLKSPSYDLLSIYDEAYHEAEDNYNSYIHKLSMDACPSRCEDLTRGLKSDFCLEFLKPVLQDNISNMLRLPSDINRLISNEVRYWKEIDIDFINHARAYFPYAAKLQASGKTCVDKSFNEIKGKYLTYSKIKNNNNLKLECEKNLTSFRSNPFFPPEGKGEVHFVEHFLKPCLIQEKYYNDLLKINKINQEVLYFGESYKKFKQFFDYIDIEMNIHGPGDKPEIAVDVEVKGLPGSNSEALTGGGGLRGFEESVFGLFLVVVLNFLVFME